MAMAAVALATVLSGFVLPAEVVTYFPGSYFDARLREPLQRQVMAVWPGPTELVRQWREAELSEGQRVALLVGGAVYHDPVMLPLYREAMASESQILRQAAAYGYRDLIADRLPRVDVVIDDESARILGDEMRWMARTLQRAPLLAVWLQSALVQEGATLPGWQGVTLHRAPRECLRSAARLAGPGDLDLLVTAFELSSDMGNRIAILEIIEAVSLSRFIVMPTGNRAGWGMDVYKTAFQSLRVKIRRWRLHGCTVDGEAVLRENLRAQQIEIADPLGPEACGLWLVVLRKGSPRWWSLAAQRLYACGGPWYELSVLQPDTEQNRARRNRLANWYEPRRERTPARGR